jgi:hypothetical protein
MNKITVIRKEPGKPPEVIRNFRNTLRSFQQAVGGYIECVTFAENAVVICNEEGRLQNLPYNCTFFGMDFVGPVLIVGTAGEDFASIPESSLPALLRLMK